MFCLDPPMVVVPTGDWVCPICSAESAAASSAFKEGEEVSLAAFEAKAHRFKSYYWGVDSEVRSISPSPQCLLNFTIVPPLVQ